HIEKDGHIGAEVQRAAIELSNRAREIYLSEQKGTTSYFDDRGATPGVQYEDSFEVRPGKDNTALVINTDKGVASFVEYGAYDKTRLGYGPLRRAVDEMATAQLNSPSGRVAGTVSLP